MTNAQDDQSLQDPAEATDGSELGELPEDETLPGTVGFPPTTPAGVGPADSLQDADHQDSFRERSHREELEGQLAPHDVVRLLDLDPNGELDTESELIGEDVPAVGQVSPEEAAMHFETDQDQPK